VRQGSHAPQSALLLVEARVAAVEASNPPSSVVVMARQQEVVEGKGSGLSV
jgi:hypothetical protein